MTENIRALLNSAIITVGNGRGFVVEGTSCRYIIAPASQMPFSPFVYKPEDNKKRERLVDRFFGRSAPEPPDWRTFFWKKKSYPKLLGQLGKKPDVSARCLFFDPISNLAILGSPGDYEGADYEGEEKQKRAYEALTDSASALRVADAKRWSKLMDAELGEAKVSVWLLSPNDSLTYSLISCEAEYNIKLLDADGVPGTFGLGDIPRSGGLPPADPFLHFGDNFAAMLGTPIVVADGSAIGIMTSYRQGPFLTNHLPGWLLRQLTSASVARIE